MSRSNFRGPTLPKTLLNRVQDGGVAKRKSANTSRKDQRKADRQQKKTRRIAPSIRKGFRTGFRGLEDESEHDSVGTSERTSARSHVSLPSKPLKSILKTSKASSGDDEVEASESSEEGLDEAEQENETTPVVSRRVKESLAQDDAEIIALERKLGIKGRKSKVMEDDGLDWLIGEEGTGSDEDISSPKRKRPEDEKWLRDKRLRATGGVMSKSEDEGIESYSDGGEGGSTSSDEQDDEELGRSPSEDDVDAEDFADFASEEEEEDTTTSLPPLPIARKQKSKENPYVPPAVSGSAPAAKYVPPSLRKVAASDEENLKHLRRQLQGQLNRLSEANLLSITQALEQLYASNARQHVTSTLVDILLGLLADPTPLNDTFLILHAGFAAALYRVNGMDFGAHLLERLVETLEHHYHRRAFGGKQSLNLIAFLSYLSVFQLTSSSIIFDYVRMLLEELSENNTELLLRVIRISGQQLRQDDPSALKDIVLLLQRAAAKVGEDSLSVRTKFMLETINNLKNNRVKTGIVASALTAEHTSKMKKTIGTLNARSKATEPLRLTLKDLKDRDKKGKWWLVGASYNDSAKLADGDDTSRSPGTKVRNDIDVGYESETPGSVNLHKLARKQGMNTDVRRAIFVTILSASDYKDAHLRLLKLHLKSKQMLEIPRVLFNCASAEETYNPYYALVAQQLCGEHRLRKAFQFTLWDAFRRMDDEAIDDDESVVSDAQMTMRGVVNIAKLCGSLVASGTLNIAILKKLDFAYLQPKMSMFVEVLVATVLIQSHKQHRHPSNEFQDAIRRAFSTGASKEVLQGLQYFIQTTVSKTGLELTSRKLEKKAIEAGCDVAVEALAQAADAGHATEDVTDDEDSGF